MLKTFAIVNYIQSELEVLKKETEQANIFKFIAILNQLLINAHLI